MKQICQSAGKALGDCNQYILQSSDGQWDLSKVIRVLLESRPNVQKKYLPSALITAIKKWSESAESRCAA
jgi:hypothetical protein